MSSAYYRWEMVKPWLFIFTALKMPIASPFSNMTCRTSATRLNSNGDRGSPCRSPLDGLNSLVGTPLTRIEVLVFFKMIVSQLIYWLSKFNFFSKWNKKSRSMVSKAFSKSNFRTRPWNFPNLRPLTTSEATKILSADCLFFIKPDCIEDTSFGNTLESLVSMILVINFIQELKRLMGLKSVTDIWSVFLGTSAMKEEFEPKGSIFVSITREHTRWYNSWTSL